MLLHTHHFYLTICEFWFRASQESSPVQEDLELETITGSVLPKSEIQGVGRCLFALLWYLGTCRYLLNAIKMMDPPTRWLVWSPTNNSPEIIVPRLGKPDKPCYQCYQCVHTYVPHIFILAVMPFQRAFHDWWSYFLWSNPYTGSVMDLM